MNAQTLSFVLGDIETAESVDALIFAEHQAGIYLDSVVAANPKNTLVSSARRLVVKKVSDRLDTLGLREAAGFKKGA